VLLSKFAGADGRRKGKGGGGPEQYVAIHGSPTGECKEGKLDPLKQEKRSILKVRLKHNISVSGETRAAAKNS